MAKATAQNPGEPPKKRKRATAAEKAARDAAMEAEKRKRQEEREKKRLEKEEAEKLKAQQKAAKAEERAAKAADKAEKEQEKKQRAEERERKKREKEEEEAKKSRSQMKLTSMFNLSATTPKKDPAASKAREAHPGSATKSETKETSLYEQMFKPFFVKEHVRLASNPFEVDEETRQAKTKILEEYLSGERAAPTPIARFDPLEMLEIPYRIRRGRVYPSVRKIMTELDDLSSKAPTDLTTESQTAQMKLTLEALKLVPLKLIQFREDVRPPYVGTISGLPRGVKSLSKLARNPISKDILPLDYGYDSEAEWQDEEGEDVDDLDDEEEEADLDEDMGDFLDDSEDVGPARMVFSGGMEPESIGPCWEDRTRKTAEQKLYKYRLEFILGKPTTTHFMGTIFPNPFSQNPSSITTASTPSRPLTGNRPSPRRRAQVTNHQPHPHPPPRPHPPRTPIIPPARAVLSRTCVLTRWLRRRPRQMRSRLLARQHPAARRRRSRSRWTCSRS
jgi:chromatin assembly factor 1 subunit A